MGSTLHNIDLAILWDACCIQSLVEFVLLGGFAHILPVKRFMVCSTVTVGWIDVSEWSPSTLCTLLLGGRRRNITINLRPISSNWSLRWNINNWGNTNGNGILDRRCLGSQAIPLAGSSSNDSSSNVIARKDTWLTMGDDNCRWSNSDWSLEVPQKQVEHWYQLDEWQQYCQWVIQVYEYCLAQGDRNESMGRLCSPIYHEPWKYGPPLQLYAIHCNVYSKWKHQQIDEICDWWKQTWTIQWIHGQVDAIPSVYRCCIETEDVALMKTCRILWSSSQQGEWDSWFTVQ